MYVSGCFADHVTIIIFKPNYQPSLKSHLLVHKIRLVWPKTTFFNGYSSVVPKLDNEKACM